MPKTCCPCCDWKIAGGVWKSHYALRKHMQEAHPDRFSQMEHDEAGVRLEIARLHRLYGAATTMRY